MSKAFISGNNGNENAGDQYISDTLKQKCDCIYSLIKQNVSPRLCTSLETNAIKNDNSKKTLKPREGKRSKE